MRPTAPALAVLLVSGWACGPKGGGTTKPNPDIPTLDQKEAELPKIPSRIETTTSAPMDGDSPSARSPVLDIMDRDVPTVPVNACLDNVFQRLQRTGGRLVGVVDSAGRLVGYITAENLSELIMIQSSRASGPGAPATRPTEQAF